MNSDEQFEKRLQGLPQRPIPAQWRGEILGAARQAARPGGNALLRLPSNLNALLGRLLWPHPKAWVGLAAIWLLVIVLNFSIREAPDAQLARQVGRPSPQMLEMLYQQEQLMAELVAPFEQPEANRTKAGAPRPRSQRREEFLNA